MGEILPFKPRLGRMVFLRRLAPAMPDVVETECVRMILGEAKQAGHDPKDLYQVAVNVRPKHWKPAPGYHVVAPRMRRKP